MNARTVHAVVFQDASSGRWVGMCLENEVTTQAESEGAVIAAVREAVELVLNGRESGEGDEPFQPIAGEPSLKTLTIRAPALLKPRG